MTILRALVAKVFTDPTRPSTPREILIGRVLAVCAHPVIAWRVLSPSGRAVVCGGYAVAAYLTVLTVLLMTHPAKF